MVINSVEQVKKIIQKIKEKRNRELAEMPVSYNENSGTGTYTNEWLVVNWKANHDISRLEELMFDLKYNKTTIDQKGIEELEKHLRNIGVLD